MIETKSGQSNLTNEDRLSITYYTDPLCCWSWSFEPQWKRLRYEFKGRIEWEYCMGGLIPDWKTYNDPLNSITRPVQMGPLWFEAKHLSGQPINDKIWMSDAPQSSYPACIAFKCAEKQSKEAGESYLRLLREAVMLHEKNIAKREVLLEIASNLSKDLNLGLDYTQFEYDLKNNIGSQAFASDLQKARYHKIGRFPTLVIRYQSKAIVIVGYRPYNVLMDAIKHLAPDMKPTQNDFNEERYFEYWGNCTSRELGEIKETPIFPGK